MNERLTILVQAFYGNRTVTTINKEEFDSFMLGSTVGKIRNRKVDRTIIKVPNTDNLVIVYNKYEEEKALLDKEEYFKEDGYVLKPLAFIPELDLEIYSRCIVCRMNEDGEFENLEPEDMEKVLKYLAD